MSRNDEIADLLKLVGGESCLPDHRQEQESETELPMSEVPTKKDGMIIFLKPS